MYKGLFMPAIPDVFTDAENYLKYMKSIIRRVIFASKETTVQL